MIPSYPRYHKFWKIKRKLHDLYLGHRGEQGDEVGEGEADQVAVGGGVETLGAPHGDDHHHVAKHPGQQDGGLEHGADDPVQGVVIFRV